MCPLGVQTFPLLVVVPLLSESMVMFLLASLYYFVKTLLFYFSIFLFKDPCSSTGRERNVIIEPCSKDMRENVDTSGEPFAHYFYIHLPIFYELRVLIPFTYFKTYFLVTVNVSPYKVIRDGQLVEKE